MDEGDLLNIVSQKLDVAGDMVTFFHPQEDDTVYGTISCIQANRFHLDKVSFEPGDVVVDIGCNVGLLSLMIATLIPTLRVIAFDASPISIDCLKRGIVANKISNLQAYCVAVGGEAKKDVRFFSNGQDTSCLVREDLAKIHPTHTVNEATVNQICIDEVFDSLLLGIGRIKYLKIDIEGGEFAIFERLYQSRPELLDRIDYLHLEVHNHSDYDAAGLQTKIESTFGNRVFFDT